MITFKLFNNYGTQQLMRPIVPGIARRLFGSTNQGDFESAQERVKQLSADPGNEAKLKLYGFFKQATLGVCNTPKPGMMDFVGKAKWSSWKELGAMTKEEAAKCYVTYVNELVSIDAGSSTNTPPSPVDKDANIIYSIKHSYAEIRLNRPKKFNAITWQMYGEIGEFLDRARRDTVKFAVITGTGDYYSSGNDLGNFAEIPPEGPEKMAKDGEKVLKKFVASFIDFDKPLIAVVNGPAVGIPVTTLGLCDIVYAKDSATFHTPFTSLGQSPEACSSYTFPLMMGPAKANEILLFGKKLSAEEACDRSLVTRVVPSGNFEEEIESMLKKYSELPPISLRTSKQIIRNTHKEKLHDINIKECALLAERWISDECISAIMKFFQRKK
ncbi:Enoyl-CoA delta isomerase 2, mitochondrial [Oopsacas minuta]|uniref:Enoyl-CoA delta isomerase 2, mitochondrial n=1 Tax=Oopsacas minuta TaxID=111878 RepID=A0AAV7JT52_9METZ|nr:Enoyl-CoA delta isomerase 2, mitochondrial [Oopsacas minuta]